MRFAPVISEKYNPAKYSDYHLVLANEIVINNDYANYYSSLDNSHTIILDSGTVEIGYADAEMIQVASEILNREVIIVAPDFLGDKVRTITETEKFLEQDWCPDKDNIMIVPQGETSEEWISCFEYLDLHYYDRFKWVGLPRIAEDFVGGRSWLHQNVMQIHRRRRGMNDQPRLHLLGIQHTVDEIEWAKHFGRIEGVDSSVPVKAAEANLLCSEVKDFRLLTDIDVDPTEEVVALRIQEMVDYTSFKWSIKTHEDIQNGT